MRRGPFYRSLKSNETVHKITRASTECVKKSKKGGEPPDMCVRISLNLIVRCAYLSSPSSFGECEHMNTFLFIKSIYVG